jgi:hypothetical protein
MMSNEGTEKAKGGKENEAAATNDQRKKNGQNRFSAGGLMGFGQSNAFEHDVPDHSHGASAKGDDRDRVGRADSITHDPEGCFK